MENINEPITRREYDDIAKRLDKITAKMDTREVSIKWIDNSEFMQVMKISRRCAQNYRDRNLIGFTIIGNKIWYKLSDVEELLSRHYHKRLI